MRAFTPRSLSATSAASILISFTLILHHAPGPSPVSSSASAPYGKGLHLALEAWLQSPASNGGRFVVAGAIIPSYRKALEANLAHPSVTVLGHVDNVPDLMRKADVLVLPSIEEGFGRVCTEAIAWGAFRSFRTHAPIYAGMMKTHSCITSEMLKRSPTTCRCSLTIERHSGGLGMAHSILLRT